MWDRRRETVKYQIWWFSCRERAEKSSSNQKMFSQVSSSKCQLFNLNHISSSHLSSHKEFSRLMRSLNNPFDFFDPSPPQNYQLCECTWWQTSSHWHCRSWRRSCRTVMSSALTTPSKESLSRNKEARSSVHPSTLLSSSCIHIAWKEMPI